MFSIDYKSTMGVLTRIDIDIDILARDSVILCTGISGFYYGARDCNTIIIASIDVCV